MKIMALIPARAGSQRVPSKNLRPLAGKPLLAYTVEAARSASSIQRVLVSTDSPEIAREAVRAGAEAPFLRPEEISRSDSTEMQFLLHCLDWLKEEEEYEPELLVLLYPTSPFRRSATIDRAVKTMLDHPEADSLRSVRPCSEHPHKMWVLEEGYLRPFVRGLGANAATLAYQSLPPVYIQNASIYITRPATIRLKGSPVGDVVVPFIMDERESLDVNTPLDFLFAEWRMEHPDRA